MTPTHSRMSASRGPAPVLRAVRTKARLEGLLLSVTSQQTYRNESSQTLEVVYTFPLPWGAVLMGLEVSLGGRTLAGQVMGRPQAGQRYEQAVEAGDAPVLVQQQRGGVYTAAIGNLKPGEEAVVALTFAQLLDFDQGQVRVVLPTTIAPRYGSAEDAGFMPDHVPVVDLFAEHPFALSLELRGAVAQATVSSPSHALAQARTEAGVTVSLSEPAFLDRDFVLLLDDLPARSFAVCGPDAVSGAGHAAMIASFCPGLVAPSGKTATPLRLKILVDCSGSMAGDSIDQARRALALLAAGLGVEDRFSYSCFGTGVQRLLPGCEGSVRNLRALDRAIRATQAVLGGTEMRAALEDTIALRLPGFAEGDADFPGAEGVDESAGADILLITDGEVWDAQAIVDAARRSGHRVYALGVGSAPAESLLRELAESTGGACEMVAPRQAMGRAVERLVAKMRRTQTVNLALELHGIDPAAVLWASALPQRVAPGETVHVFLRAARRFDAEPVLGLDDARFVAPVSHSGDTLIARLVAARQIAALGDEVSDRSPAQDLALRYQLVTEHTSLLLVFERAADGRTNGMPSLHQVSQMMAAGWGGVGTVMERLRASSRGAMSVGGADYSGMVVPPVMFRRGSVAAAPRDDYRAMFERITAKRDVVSKAAPARAPLPVPAPSMPTCMEMNRRGAAAAVLILRAFNDAYARHRLFRIAVREVMKLRFGEQLDAAINAMAKETGSFLNAWAICLMWLQERGDLSVSLSTAALDEVMARVDSMEEEAVERAREVLAKAGQGRAVAMA